MNTNANTITADKKSSDVKQSVRGLRALLVEATATLLLLVVSAPQLHAGTPSGFGTNLGNVNGVAVYSNGYSGYNSNSFNYSSRLVNGKSQTFQTGMAWQCCELPSRYQWLVNAKQYVAINAYKWFNAGYRGLRAVPNGSAELPPQGAIVCWSGGSSGLGHLAVVYRTPSASDTTVITANQNVNVTADDVTRWVTLTVKKDTKGKITGCWIADNGPNRGSKSYVCQGWLVPN